MRELIVDNFAGGGGASTGIEMALGISPDIAINHDDVALAMHQANHPDTKHLHNNVWKIDPDEIDGPIGLGWFSPDCKHFSKAKGGKPVERGVRDLAWVVVRWARRRSGGPRVIILENVEEFQTWGPLGNGEGNPGRPVDAPVSTILQSGSHQGLVAANLLRQFGTGVGSAMDQPTRTVMTDGGGKTQLSAAFLQKYYGVDQDPRLEEPLHTVTTKDRFGLATVMIEGEPYVISDIGMRMLSPRELFRAQGFPESYIIDRRPDGTPISKTDQVAKCGNSVCPPLAMALVKANFAPRDVVAPGDREFFLEAAE